MVIDTSAVVAILNDEPERAAFNRSIAADPVRLISAATLLESALVIESRRGEHAGMELDLFLHRAKFEVVPVDAEQAEIARGAFRRYGKGRDRAGLNFGDCFAYTLAQCRAEPLLFKDQDFLRTDVLAVAYGA